MPPCYGFLQDGMNYILDNSLTSTFSLINYYVSGSDYDDVLTQTLVGSSVISGLIFPMRGKSGSTESMLLEQGKLLTTDKILYIKGDSDVDASGTIVKLHSPVEYYNIIPNGVTTYEVNGSPVYKKLFLRRTLTGSLY
jgi:hypothetical protein